MKLHTKYERSGVSGFREEDFLRFSYEKLISRGVWPGHNLNKISNQPLGDNTFQISKLQALWFQRRGFLKFSYITLCKTYEPRGGAIFGPGVII